MFRTEEFGCLNKAGIMGQELKFKEVARVADEIACKTLGHRGPLAWRVKLDVRNPVLKLLSSDRVVLQKLVLPLEKKGWTFSRSRPEGDLWDSLKGPFGDYCRPRFFGGGIPQHIEDTFKTRGGPLRKTVRGSRVCWVLRWAKATGVDYFVVVLAARWRPITLLCWTDTLAEATLLLEMLARDGFPAFGTELEVSLDPRLPVWGGLRRLTCGATFGRAVLGHGPAVGPACRSHLVSDCLLLHGVQRPRVVGALPRFVPYALIGLSSVTAITEALRAWPRSVPELLGAPIGALVGGPLAVVALVGLVRKALLSLLGCASTRRVWRAQILSESFLRDRAYDVF